MIRGLLLGVLIMSAGAVWLIPLVGGQSTTEAHFAIHFLDVGQGDAILAVTPSGKQILIDGGPDNGVLPHVTDILGFTDRHIDVVVGTHPDLDHIAGLVEILKRYTVDTIITTETAGESPAAAAWQSAVAAEGADVHLARADAVYEVDASTTITVLSPKYNPERLNPNTSSVVVLLTYGDVTFLLTGDAPAGVEEYLVDTYGSQLKADVLKLGHHGSDTSSASSFLKAVQPAFAVVSAGVNNNYNHPDPDVLKRVDQHTDATIVSTQHGTVSFASDGNKVWLTQ